MADKPILFSGPMVQSLLAGRKTQTRRIMPRHDCLAQAYRPIVIGGRVFNYSGDEEISRAPFTIGDRLWVREAWKACAQMDGVKPSDMSQHEPRMFLADDQIVEPACMMIKPGRYRPPMFMPRWASRLTLTVTDVRVQRVQEISEADAQAEGVEASGWRPSFSDPDNAGGHESISAKDEFSDLWDGLNAKRGYSWASNPWVAAYSFEVAKINIDQMGAFA
tara:strand:+ start:43393 stop:44052 length:660 start_codon:yes stop_codon:yes gene_type:complete